MREYSFKGKKIDTGNWVYGNGVVVVDKDYIAIPLTKDVTSSDYAITLAKIVPETVCQFSGHQVNGINLYESDIVRNEKMEDEYDTTEYLVCVFIKEWAMFGLLTIEEYHKYKKEGAEALDETMFWTFPINDKDNEQRRICGNIYSHPELLQSL
jgi:hypothetical protein